MIHAPKRTLTDDFKIGSRGCKRGEPIVRGYVDTGDHVFVDKFTYNFRKPQRGDVFVFNTQKLPTIERRRFASDRNERNDPLDFDLATTAAFADRQHIIADMSKPSQFYIKRLTGTPGDELRVEPPSLFVNGKHAEGRAFARVMAAQDGYEGYVLGSAGSFLMPILQSPEDRYTVPERHYFAMGDNSKHSSDSRDWGPVPQQNIMGRGLFVYWPFASHWGLIR